MSLRIPPAVAAMIAATLVLSACAAPHDPASTAEPTAPASAAPSPATAPVVATPAGTAEAAPLESPAPTASAAAEPSRAAEDPVGFVERWAADGFASLLRAPEYFCEDSLSADAQMDYNRLEQDAHRSDWTHTIELDEYSSERFPAVDVVFRGPNHTVLHVIGLSRTDSGYCVSSITIPGVSPRD